MLLKQDLSFCSPALYVGQYQHGLYALPAMTHDEIKLNVRHVFEIAIL